jgi:membrane-associated protease RseP (regulator of RpoE activity)
MGNYDSPLRRVIWAHWDDGLIYMGCVLAILLTHEMGHFLATVRYRVPASLPFFLPLPISPIGTMGAVIGMDGRQANRKETFDIGIAGPLAGLVVAIPILWIGIMKLDFAGPPAGVFQLDTPLAAKLMLNWVRPEGYEPGQPIWQSQLNPYFMAGWIGMFITGLNMMPVSQLDGGHVIYTLFGKRSYWIARAFMLLAVAAMLTGLVHNGLWLMLVVIMLFGTDHPPTRDDRVRLGWLRTSLGLASLTIPVFCFAPQLFIVSS